MTKEEKIIATAFTGKMFIDGSDMGLLYEYMEKKVGHGVIDLMLADRGFWEELHKACEKDFIDMVSKEQPDFPTTDEQIKEFLATHPKIKVPEKYKNPDWLFKKREQQEDLDADIEMEWDSFNKHLAKYGEESEDVVWLNWHNFNELAHHFYELGLKAK